MPFVSQNFSHGSYEYHQSVIDNTRKSCEGKPLLLFLIGGTSTISNIIKVGQG